MVVLLCRTSHPIDASLILAVFRNGYTLPIRFTRSRWWRCIVACTTKIFGRESASSQQL